MCQRGIWRIFVGTTLAICLVACLFLKVYAFGQYSSVSIGLGPSYQTASPGQVVNYHVSASVNTDRLAGFHGEIMVTFSTDLRLAGDPICQSGCNSVFVSTGNSVILEANFRLYDGDRVDFSFSVIVPSDAAVGTSYTLVAYLLGGENTGSSSETSYAELVVGETQPDQNVGTTSPVAGIYAFPEAVRLSPDGKFTMVVRPYATIEGTDSSLSVNIMVPRSLKIVSGPYCVADLSNLNEQKRCLKSSGAGPAGSALRTVKPSVTNDALDSIVITLAPSGEGEGDFAQVVASLDDVDANYNRDSSLAYTNVNFSDSVESGSRSLLLELTSDFHRDGSFCSSGDPQSLPNLGIEMWDNPDSYYELEASQGFLAESTSEVDSQSCYIPFVLPTPSEDAVYIVKTGHCLRCGVGLLTPSSDADQVVLFTREG